MQDFELQRYARHILLDDIGVEGQTRILQSHALVIGAGGLGSPACTWQPQVLAGSPSSTQTWWT
jgi:molybdopterin-synthase adenylyltransferase